MTQRHERAAPVKRVLVLSYFGTTNFGDRLGYHVLNSLLPAHAEVTYANLYRWDAADLEPDLVILGIGNSLLPADALNAGLISLLARVPHSIGIFGTQYRSCFRSGPTAEGLARILDTLTTWWARYQDDIALFGGARSNVRHLGDWLMAAFPLASPTLERGLTIPKEFALENMPLDRAIQRIQAYAAVDSARLHPLLCALTSAREVLYREQRDLPNSEEPSGKFASLLRDVFGREYEEGKAFRVDRAAVIDYKRTVERNIDSLRDQLRALLAL